MPCSPRHVVILQSFPIFVKIFLLRPIGVQESVVFKYLKQEGGVTQHDPAPGRRTGARADLSQLSVMGSRWTGAGLKDGRDDNSQAAEVVKITAGCHARPADDPASRFPHSHSR